MRAVSEVASKRPRYFTSLSRWDSPPRRGCAGGLAEVEVAEAHIGKVLQTPPDARLICKKR